MHIYSHFISYFNNKRTVILSKDRSCILHLNSKSDIFAFRGTKQLATAIKAAAYSQDNSEMF